jgi:DNA-binding CsgD family transcriptional regulator
MGMVQAGLELSGRTVFKKAPSVSPRSSEEARSGPDRVERLVAHALDWLTMSVPAAMAVFSTVDRRMNAFTRDPIVVKAAARADPFAFVLAARPLDPFAPYRWADSTMPVVGIRELGGQHAFAQSPFGAFLASHGLASQTSMYFRSAGRIVATIALLRGQGDPDMSPAEIMFLRRSHTFLEQAYVVAHGRPAALEHMSLANSAGLTPRELEVARLVGAGASNGEIARHLSITLATVKTHMTRVLAKLGVRSRTELVVLLRGSGLADR